MFEGYRVRPYMNDDYKDILKNWNKEVINSIVLGDVKLLI